jgi:hypothetical protein
MGLYILWGFAILGGLAFLGLISMALAPEEGDEDD